MATLSLDLRERIIRAYDKGDRTRDEIAQSLSVKSSRFKKCRNSATVLLFTHIRRDSERINQLQRI